MAGTGAQDEVRKVIDETLAALNAGDAAGCVSCSPSVPMVSISALTPGVGDEKQVVEAVAAAGGADDIQVVAGGIGIHLRGDVAWAEGHGRFTRAGGGARPARMTWVLIREHGQWKFVQSHASIGVPDGTPSANTRPSRSAGRGPLALVARRRKSGAEQGRNHR